MKKAAKDSLKQGFKEVEYTEIKKMRFGTMATTRDVEKEVKGHNLMVFTVLISNEDRSALG